MLRAGVAEAKSNFLYEMRFDLITVRERKLDDVNTKQVSLTLVTISDQHTSMSRRAVWLVCLGKDILSKAGSGLATQQSCCQRFEKLDKTRRAARDLLGEIVSELQNNDESSVEKMF